MKRIKVKIKQPQKCYRFFYDDAGQGFTPPCCRMTDKTAIFYESITLLWNAKEMLINARLLRKY